MDVRDRQPTEREAELMQANREELIERIGRAIGEDGAVQPLSGLRLARLSSPRGLIYSVMEPSLARPTTPTFMRVGVGPTQVEAAAQIFSRAL